MTNALSLTVIALTAGLPADLSWRTFAVPAAAAVVGNQIGVAVNRRVSQAAFRLGVTLLVIASGVVTATT